MSQVIVVNLRRACQHNCFFAVEFYIDTMGYVIRFAAKKKAKEPCDDLVAQIKTIGEEIAASEAEQKALKIEIDKLLTTIGNIVEDDVPGTVLMLYMM